jgi:predicted alpha/beta hydrolase family esterase
MKKVILVHGWDGSPKEPMHQWIKKQAESIGFEVVVPLMPNPTLPEIKAWVSHLAKIAGKIDNETIFIGHSIGAQAVLRYMETLPKM